MPDAPILHVVAQWNRPTCGWLGRWTEEETAQALESRNGRWNHHNIGWAPLRRTAEDKEV